LQLRKHIGMTPANKKCRGEARHSLQLNLFN
jgi:hypothetical protein